MKIKKRNIELATSVSIIMLLVLAYVHFADEEELFRVGNRIEEILHIYTNISVVKMQSFIEVVTSGVLGSALVALFFLCARLLLRTRKGVAQCNRTYK